jgi:hypothetical protein
LSSFTITYPNDKYFHETFVAQQVQKYLQGQLIAEAEAIHRDIGEATSVDWIEEQYSDAGDVYKPTDIADFIVEQASEFRHVKFAPFTVESAVLPTYGLEMDFSKECRRNKTAGVDFIQRGMQRGAYFLAALINTLVFNNMTNSWSSTASSETNNEPWNQAATAVWSDVTNRRPNLDLKDIKLLVADTENYANELDRAYVRYDNNEELIDYLQNTTNIPWVLDPKTNAWNQMYKGVRFIPSHKLSGIPASTALFLSRGVKPTTVYERKDTAFARKPLKDNAGNTLPGIYHTQVYETPQDNVVHVKIWRELYPVTDRWGRKSVGILRTL